MAMHFGGLKSASLPHADAILAGISEQGAWALVHASEELRKNAEFVLSAVIQDGGCLMYASDELCDDEQVVLAAVEQDGNAMRYASAALKSDPVFAAEAVKKSSKAILYVSRELRQDPQFTLQAALSGCSRDLLDPRLAVWLEQRDELLARMRAAIDGQDVFGVREVIKDGEEHGLSDQDLEEPRMALKKLIKYSEVGSLWEPLRRGEGDREPPVVLIRGSWLSALAKSGGRLPRRQDLPPEAIWDSDELERDAEAYDKGRHQLATRVVAISYCWLRREHPDPYGEQLAAAGALASSCLEELGEGVDLAIFLDYCSLFQEPRTEIESEVFAESLQSVAIWYAHKKTQVWVLTATPEACGLPEELVGTEPADLPVMPYEHRGWPSFERNVAELLACEGGAGQSILLIDGAAQEQLLQSEKMSWPEILDAFKANQEPPKVPDAFCDLLATKTFTAPEDLQMLQDAYTIVFKETMHTMRNLVYCDLGWGDAAAADLSLAVQACHLLVNIELEGNAVADEGCRVLFDAFAACSSLAQITLRANRVGDLGARHIAAQLPRCLSMEELDLSFNKIANAGAEDFIRMLQGGVHPSLKEVRLNNNLVGSSFRMRLTSVALETHGSDFAMRV